MLGRASGLASRQHLTPINVVILIAIGWLGFGPLLSASADPLNPACPKDSIPSGTICIDKYEASVWKTTDPRLIRSIRAGSVSLDDLKQAGAAVQLGVSEGDLSAAGCPVGGNGCTDIYAVSIPGVTPATRISWFQAVAASRNAGKRLPTNAEWQAAALGTPDGAPCRIGSAPGGPLVTGTLGCTSDVGAFDMVGNVWEWVADWVPLSTACPGWLVDGVGFVSDDTNCLAGASTTFAPGALFRGGDFTSGAGAGVYAVNGANSPFKACCDALGFRAARPL